MSEPPSTEPHSRAPGSSLAPRVGAAVAIAAGVAVAMQMFSPSRPAQPPSAPTVVNAPEPASVDTERWLAAFPLEPLAAPTLSGTSQVTRELNRALEPYRKGDYRAAATALDGFLLDHPDEATAVLYLGISRLFVDEPQNALEILRAIPGSAPEPVMAEAAWYSVVGIARLRDPSSAEAEARVLCDAKGPAAPKACAALDRLEKRR
jgi:hypothetical protein